MDRVRLALDGLSVGDAFGEQFFGPYWIEARAAPPGTWRYTDDTVMALGIAEVLERHGKVDQDDLARTFARRYALEPWRGYGGAAHQALQALGRGSPWRMVASQLFGGQGSMGNGGAMRVAPVGAYFADDFEAAAAQARASAEVTHAHPEGQAGAIAVAVAGAWAWRFGQGTAAEADWWTTVLDLCPPGGTRTGLEQARALPADTSVEDAAAALGSGYQVTAPDTVPFTLWCAARHLDDYEEALWTTVAGWGDMDTTCAIVGGLVALATGREGIPPAWLAAREPLLWSG